MILLFIRARAHDPRPNINTGENPRAELSSRAELGVGECRVVGCQCVIGHVITYYKTQVVFHCRLSGLWICIATTATTRVYTSSTLSEGRIKFKFNNKFYTFFALFLTFKFNLK